QGYPLNLPQPPECMASGPELRLPGNPHATLRFGRIRRFPGFLHTADTLSGFLRVM
ncbi:hypothetical protein BaRGS_00002446, partial [Batillaria attramentaria]